ncbi:FGGY family carbohydrate kinase [Streptomyces sp. RS10V-4]|uniref:FGGY-family carbohydrate kinase n=1 Tax=Streptomyces rhizoryzae TaxID=2932493 RepID=UPI0020055465|nr:FGGY family carbohydrate kinase [Streptomyces rhizoryzae]MCK7625687.1 FGGY family carbohydrate kinase [Streptomyces rhizoryzae]
MSDPHAPPPPPDAIWLGLDLGPRSARCLAVDGTGALLATAARPLTGHRTGNRHEQDPATWWPALAEACREALTGLDPHRIRGLALDGTSGTILLTDPHGTPRTPALMYDDGRATDQAATCTAAGAHLWRDLGYRTMPPTWALPKLRWLLDHDPTLATGSRLLHQTDLIAWQLAGRQLPSDTSHALTTGYHLLDERWPHDVLDTLAIPTGLLPDVVRPGTVLGTVTPGAADATGIPAGTAIVAGMTNDCAAQIGAGALTPGAWNAALGTTLVLKGTSDHLVRDPAGLVHCHRGPAGTWLPGGASNSGAGVISHYFHGENLDVLTEQAAAQDPDAVAYPLVSTGGERFPFRAPEAEPFILGATPTRAAEFHAYLLGVACLERLCFDYLDHLGAPTAGPLTYTGGAARNTYWCRLRAEVLGRTVHVPEHADSALGMAVLAATSAGTGRAATAAAMLRPGTEIRPAPDRTARHLPAYRRFVTELTDRGWLDPAVADHALSRTAP